MGVASALHVYTVSECGEASFSSGIASLLSFSHNFKDEQRSAILAIFKGQFVCLLPMEKARLCCFLWTITFVRQFKINHLFNGFSCPIF